MLWFKKDKPGTDAQGGSAQESYPLVARQAWCSVCDAYRTFTTLWRRAVMMRKCPNCGLAFEDPEPLYQRAQPTCPKCREPLEQPSFDYGYCDSCGSKFELVEGGKPGLLPNQRQRDEMDKHGKSWSYS